MKKRILFAILMMIMVIGVAVFTSCGGADQTDYSEIKTNGMTYENGEYKLTVSPETETIDLTTKFSVSENAYYELYRNGDYSNLLESATVDLVNGSNIFNVKIFDYNSHMTEYKFNIYRKQMFTVQFNTDGGSEVASVSVEEGKVIEAPSSFKLGYDFTGWDYDFSNPITSSLTINASWTPKQFNITYNINGEKSTVDILYGEAYEAPNVELNGYNFLGWLLNNAAFSSEGKFEYTENIEVVASLQPIEYSIIYVLEDGCNNLNTETKYNILSNIELLNAEWKNDEKVFDGWYTDISLAEEFKITAISGMTGTITLYPKFKDAIITKNVQFSVNGQIIDSETVQFTYKAPYDITFTPDVDEFHKFDGWYYGDVLIASQGDLWSYKTDLVLEAKITAREYDIEYVLNGTNNPDNPTSFNADESITLLAPTYGIHEFAGWYSDHKFTTKVETITAEYAGQKLTLYAKWNYRYSVKFDFDGGEGDDSEKILAPGAEYQLPVATKAKYTFGGWYDGETKVDSVGLWGYQSDVTLKAKWIPIEYRITYIGFTIEDTIYNVETGEITLPTPSDNYKTFAGWYLESTFENPVTVIDSTQYEGVTLYAKWDQIEIEVQLDAVIGQVTSSPITIILGSNYNLPKPVHSSCTFLGWKYNGDFIDQNGTWTINEDNILLVAEWDIPEFVIDYDLDGGSADNLVTVYTPVSEDIVLPKPTKDGYSFIGWITSTGISDNVVIPKGSVGDRSYKASWYKNQDENGFFYELRNGVMVVVGYDKEIDVFLDYVPDIYVPTEYYGYKVTSIDSEAFVQFGKKFTSATYIKSNGKTYKYMDGHDEYGFTKIYLSTEINHIGANAFEGCYGMKVQLYSPTGSADCTEWDKGVTYESGNKAVRDCIWGFRPALGWSRYTLAEIPEGYDK